MGIIGNLIINSLAILITAYFLPGVHVNNYLTALIVAVVLGIANAVIKPILVFFTLPFTIVTLGLFIFVINGIIILLISAIVPGFSVNGLLTAIIFSLIISVISSFLHSIT